MFRASRYRPGSGTGRFQFRVFRPTCTRSPTSAPEERSSSITSPVASARRARPRSGSRRANGSVIASVDSAGCRRGQPDLPCGSEQPSVIDDHRLEVGTERQRRGEVDGIEGSQRCRGKRGGEIECRPVHGDLADAVSTAPACAPTWAASTRPAARISSVRARALVAIRLSSRSSSHRRRRRRLRLLPHQLDQRRRVEVGDAHRSSRRRSSSASLRLDDPSPGRGSTSAGSAVGTVSRPVSTRLCQPASRNGESRATGRPRSVTVKVSPPATSFSHRLACWRRSRTPIDLMCYKIALRLSSSAEVRYDSVSQSRTWSSTSSGPVTLTTWYSRLPLVLGLRAMRAMVEATAHREGQGDPPGHRSQLDEAPRRLDEDPHRHRLDVHRPQRLQMSEHRLEHRPLEGRAAGEVRVEIDGRGALVPTGGDGRRPVSTRGRSRRERSAQPSPRKSTRSPVTSSGRSRLGRCPAHGSSTGGAPERRRRDGRASLEEVEVVAAHHHQRPGGDVAGVGVTQWKPPSGCSASPAAWISKMRRCIERTNSRVARPPPGRATSWR